MGKRKEIQLFEKQINGEVVYSKQCTGCGEIKELRDFHKSDNGLGGRISRCKMCKSKFVKKYNKTDAIKNKVFELGGKRVKVCRACQVAKEVSEFYPHGTNYVSKCKPCYKLAKRKGTGPKPIKVVNLDGRNSKECRSCGTVKSLEEFSINSNGKGIGGRKARCKECMREFWKERRLEHRDSNNLRTRKWRLANPEKQAASKKRWRLNNKHREKVYQNNRKTKKLSLRNDLTHEQWQDVLSHFNQACALSCEGNDVTMDHFIPISIGKGGTYVGNVYPLSATLNFSKHNRNPFEWYMAYGALHEVDEAKWKQLLSYLAEENGMTEDDFKKYVNALFEEVSDE